MRAIIQTHSGDPSVLQLSEVATPVPGPEQLLVKVHAAAINRLDILQRRGKYPIPAGESEILGLEIAGELVSCGNQVTHFTLGQRVFGLVGSGGYAEYCLLDQGLAFVMPDNWSYSYAAAIPEVFLTANETICELGELKSGETILIHAGGSGVGTAAIQLAYHIGATVYITTGSQQKIEKALLLGAAAGINYKIQDFEQEIKSLTKHQGVDVIEDFIGADYFQKNLNLLKPGGRLIQVALMSGQQVTLDLRQILANRLQIKGSVMRTQDIAAKRAIVARFTQRWLALLQQGKIKPVIDAVFPITMVVEAHRYVEANRNFGKVVLEW